MARMFFFFFFPLSIVFDNNGNTSRELDCNVDQNHLKYSGSHAKQIEPLVFLINELGNAFPVDKSNFRETIYLPP